MLGKLIEKTISNRLQLHVVSNNFIHHSQLGSLKFKSTTNTGVALTHFIHTGWVKNLLTSTLAFDISQFFPSLNHHLLSLILRKAGLDSSIVQFFSSYLVNRKTKYVWNNSSSHFVDVNVGVGQGSALSPILLALYLAPFLYILEKQLKSLNLQTSLLSFVDDGLLITQSKSFETSNAHLFCSSNIALNFLTKFGLQVEHSKTEVFYFSRAHGIFNPSSLDLSPLGSLILSPKSSWYYLSFIFDRKISFHSHIDFYANNAISTIKYMKILGNSTRGLNLYQKYLLYRCCTILITLYSFQLWHYNKAPLSYLMKIMNKMQRRAALWIVGGFKMAPSMGIEAIAGLTSINLHLQKTGGRSQLRAHSLPSSHILRSLMSSCNESPLHQHPLLLNSLIRRQYGLIKGHLVDMNNHFNEFFPSFDPINPELFTGHRIIDTFSNCFIFQPFNKQVNHN